MKENISTSRLAIVNILADKYVLKTSPPDYLLEDLIDDAISMGQKIERRSMAVFVKKLRVKNGNDIVDQSQNNTIDAVLAIIKIMDS